MSDLLYGNDFGGVVRPLGAAAKRGRDGCARIARVCRPGEAIEVKWRRRKACTRVDLEACLRAVPQPA